MTGTAPATALADVIVPEVFNPYVIQRSTELNAFFQSGIIATLPEVASLMGGGKTVNMPFFEDLSGDDEVIDDTSDLTDDNIETGKDIAAVLMRAKVFGSSDLSAMLSGSDPMMAIAELFAGYWSRRMQEVLLNCLKGAMATTNSGGSMAANTYDISAVSPASARVFDAEAFIAACAKLGDAQDSLAGVGVHSDTYTLMKNEDLIDFIKPSDGGQDIPVYQGKRVIVDDKMPKTSAGVYTSYIFGPGSIGYAEGSPKVPSATWREEKRGGGTEFIVNRRKFVMHPRGIAWTGTPASKPTPANTDLATANKWTRVYDQKNIRIVRFIHKVA